MKSSPTGGVKARAAKLQAKNEPYPAIAAWDLAQRLGGHEKTAGSGIYVAQCPGPGHRRGDQKPSLEISTGRTGKVIAYCQVCEDLLKFTDVLKKAGVFDDKHQQSYVAEEKTVVPIEELRQNTEPVEERVVIRYVYTDEIGNRHIRINRTNTKRFPADHWENGKWIPGVKDVRRVLYRLPELLNNPKRIVFIVEGEKDVRTLERLKLVATTNPFGAGKWLPEYSAVLKGRRIVFIQDNDAAGQKHHDKVIPSLCHAGMRWIKVLHMPGDGVKDVTDWIDAGGTREQLLAMVKAAPEYNQATAPKPKTEILSYADIPLLADCRNTEIKYIEEPVLAVGMLTTFTGSPECGKSSLATAIVWRAHNAGHPVLILDRENPSAIVIDRHKRLGVVDGPDFKHWGGWTGQQAASPDSEIVVTWVRECLAADGPVPIVVVDSQTAFHGGDENSASDTQRFLKQLTDLTDLGATVILIHHDGKASTAKLFRGSSAFNFKIDLAYHVTNASDDGKLSRLTLECFKHRPGDHRKVVYLYAGGRMIPRGDEDKKTAEEELMELVRDNPGVTGSAFERMASTVTSKYRARRFLADGVRAKTISCKPGKGAAQRYFAADQKSAPVVV